MIVPRSKRRQNTRRATLALITIAAAAVLAVGLTPAPGDAILSGVVEDETGPVAGATVRIQATDVETLTDAKGRFELPSPDPRPVTVSAWKHGFYSARAVDVEAPAKNIVLRLHPYQTDDNPEYVWALPYHEDPDVATCAECKAHIVVPWMENAHATSAMNPRYLSMYNGTDVYGNQSPLTQYATSKDYGRFPLRPVLDETYFGPGYKLDFPYTAGNCGACHNPGAAVDDAYGVDPNRVSGADLFGVHCDYCHKVADVILDPETQMPYTNRPGVLSSDVRRSFENEDGEIVALFFGPFDDPNVDEGDTCLPLIQESAFCAPCHFGVFWDTVIYNSYGEWLHSPYSDPLTGATCQECHMPAPTLIDGIAMTNVAPGRGGIERDPNTLRSHAQLGASDVEFLQNAVTMEVQAIYAAERVTVDVAITNDRTGHHVPTGSPLRHLILLVEAVDDSGASLVLQDGPELPTWCGEGVRSEGNYAGLPGVAYAKVLEELWTEISPSGAYWNPTRIVSDNRIAAFETATSSYAFWPPSKGTVRIRVTLLYRRAFKELMEQKSWNVPDILMKEIEQTLTLESEA